MAAERYDTIGVNYRKVRVPDARVADLLDQALGHAVSVVNVGAGAGSYESPGRRVVGVEPSAEMIRQRPRDAAPCVVGRAESLPFEDASVDACTAIWTVHHWVDLERGLREMRRIARGPVAVMSYVPGVIAPSSRWLTSTYFPYIGGVDEKIFPRLPVYEAALGPCRVVPVPIPADCRDGFLDAFWSRPEAYLEEDVRAGMSGFRLMPEGERNEGLKRLASDLENDTWDRLFGHLRRQTTFDAGVRIVVARA